ncbi:Nuclear transport factor 2 family protein with RNA binding domain [Quillaja saponaria]|uniref:Nuclear transport factor 2 family protein with RNA binding domain n=1 Tax=Quillaja saponaria TaxID=32244 RepID=A0AAD7QA35_QUISA|nr:Nuclear transport factor 2 family protein with RNA binding domain [Quillaja saponaria]
MASSYPGSVSAVQVGSYFVGQYYQVLQQQPSLVHQFYSDASTMTRIDGDSSDTVSATLKIHTRIMSLNFAGIEIKTINSLDSWNGGVLVMVSGFVRIQDFGGRRRFVQTFFLAPQEKGYFVLNDIFQFIDDEVVYQNRVSLSSESKFDIQLNASSSLPETHEGYSLDEETREYASSVHIDNDLVDKYSLPDQHQELEPEAVVEETPVEETSTSFESVVNTIHEPPVAPVEEPVEEPAKKTWASILRVSKGQSGLTATPHPNFSSAPSPSEVNHTAPPAIQQSSSTSTYIPETRVEAREEGFGLEEGKFKSVYVRNLPSNVTEVEIEQEFKNFGRIKPDGIFIRTRNEIGVCYAFVEFEDTSGVQNAIQASPIQLAGRQVYIEERRPNSSSTARGGRRGRGRGGYQTEAPRGRFGGWSLGRGANLDSGDYSRLRGNGYPQRGSG